MHCHGVEGCPLTVGNPLGEAGIYLVALMITCRVLGRECTMAAVPKARSSMFELNAGSPCAILGSLLCVIDAIM